MPAPHAPRRAPADPLDDLLVRARELRAEGHPGTHAAWDRVAARVAADGTEPDVVLAADLLEHRARCAALAGAAEARDLIAESARAHHAAGQPGRAAFAAIRAVSAAASSGAEPDEIRALLETADRAAAGLAADDPDRARRIATAQWLRIRVEAYLRVRESDHIDGHPHDADARYAEEVAAFVADRTACATEEGVAHLLAEAETTLGRLALDRGDPAAERLFASAAERAVAAGRPWEATEPLTSRAGLLFAHGDAAGAETCARTALDHAAELTDPEEQGAVRLTLADILLRRGGDPEEAARHALDAAHWFDQAGLAEAGGAQARQLLARAYATAGRTAEAAEVLQSALPDLVQHGEGREVAVRETLGGLLLALNDPRAAAEQFLLAADVAKGWDDPRGQAQLAHGAAEALTRAGLDDQAEAAYVRSLDLWRQAGDEPVAEVRVLRSLAWLATHDWYDEDGEQEGVYAARAAAALERARARMGEASAVLDAHPDAPPLRFERAQTAQQLARLIDQYADEVLATHPDGDGEAESAPDGDDRAESAPVRGLREEVLGLYTAAEAGYADLGGEALEERFQVCAGAAWAAFELGRGEEAVARVESFAAELERLRDGQDDDRQDAGARAASAKVPAELLKRAETVLDRLRG